MGVTNLWVPVGQEKRVVEHLGNALIATKSYNVSFYYEEFLVTN